MHHLVNIPLVWQEKRHMLLQKFLWFYLCAIWTFRG